MNVFRIITAGDPAPEPSCIFDVGANISQTVGQIRAAWPAVHVHAFEPIGATFAQL